MGRGGPPRCIWTDGFSSRPARAAVGPRSPTARPELRPAQLPLLREVSPQWPEGRCGASTLGLPAPPVGRCPGRVVDVPQEALGFGVQGCSSAASSGDKEDSPASARGACWPAPWPGQRAVHAPPPVPAGLRAWPALGSCSWVGRGWEETPEGFLEAKAGLGLTGVYERHSGKPGKALLAEGRASAKQGNRAGRETAELRPDGATLQERAWTTLALPPLQLTPAPGPGGGGGLGPRQPPPAPPHPTP